MLSIVKQRTDRTQTGVGVDISGKMEVEGETAKAFAGTLPDILNIPVPGLETQTPGEPAESSESKDGADKEKYEPADKEKGGRGGRGGRQQKPSEHHWRFACKNGWPTS